MLPHLCEVENREDILDFATSKVSESSDGNVWNIFKLFPIEKHEDDSDLCLDLA